MAIYIILFLLITVIIILQSITIIQNKKRKKEASNTHPTSWNTRFFGIIVQDIYGNKIITDPRDNCVSEQIRTNGVWEKPMCELLQKIIKKEQIILSLGGHIGYHVIQMAKASGSNGKIYCFEANPHTYEYLVHNLRLNQLSHVTTFPKAAYSKNQTLDLAADFKGQTSNTGGSYIPSNPLKIRNHESRIKIEGVKIDDYLNSVSHIDLLQMDIEGSEIAAIEGAVKLIDRSPNLTVIQEWITKAMNTHSNVSDYIQFWRNKKYQFGKIESDQITELSDQELLEEDFVADVVITKNLTTIQALHSQ